MSMLLHCQQIRKNYGTNVVFEPLELDVERGEALCLVGPSGCGKTTLLRCIAGLERLTGGRIFLDGQDITAIGAAQRPVVLMFQQSLLFPHLTVLENVIYGLKATKVDKKTRLQVGQELLAKIEMSEFARRYPSELSGGQQQRVSLARALAVKPQLLLLDEPFSNLDPDLRGTIRNWVRKLLKAEGMTAIFVTHDKEEAMLLGDRVAVMLEHRIQQVGPPLAVYLNPCKVQVAEFYSEGLLLEDGSFVHISQLRLLSGEIKQVGEPHNLRGWVTGKYMQSGQSFYQVRLGQGGKELTISDTTAYQMGDPVTVGFDQSAKVFLK